MKKLTIIIKTICLCLFFVRHIQASEPKVNQETGCNNLYIQSINKHLQENYYINLNKKLHLILTGQMVDEFDKQLKNKTYTNFKIEF
jgi:hypothetical protein